MTAPFAAPLALPQELTWQQQIARGIHAVTHLVDRGLLSANAAEALRAVEARYQVAISTYYLSLIDWSDPHCPIRLQALPHPDELISLPTEMADPIGDHVHRRPPVVVHRYPDRALLFPTLRCPMFCRYCFRKVYLNEQEPVALARDIDQALEYLRQQTGIREVILSGGDPLMLSDQKLEELLARLRQIPHVRRLRIHTRVPATLPARLTPSLARLLSQAEPLLVVSHFNHPKELTPIAQSGAETLRQAGVPVFNQSVLLAGINDDAQVLRTLFEGLLEWGVRPYYLHHPDLTVGTGHFRVSLERGREIYRALRGSTSGLAIPHYVLEVPGGGGKIGADSAQTQPTQTPGIWWLQSPFGPKVRWVDPAIWPSGAPE